MGELNKVDDFGRELVSHFLGSEWLAMQLLPSISSSLLR